MNRLSNLKDTIVALATPPGTGAIGLIRLSGPEALAIAEKIFQGRKLRQQPSHTVHFGHIISQEADASELVDEVVVTLFKGPKSYTGEDVVEISAHGSPYILQKILEIAAQAGARTALPGEFTQRAFLNGKLDLAQAEAVADLIAANTKAAQQTALNQLRGGFSHDLMLLRSELINFTALIELELDFSDEDVEFADKSKLKDLVSVLSGQVNTLIDSFRLGNAIKNGISVAIIGVPNAGKSTLLNALLNEERAIVSDIAGTTRDTIEESLNIQGVLFRLIDTAGIRSHTTDVIENKGIERSRANAEKADIIVHLIDLLDNNLQPTELEDWLLPYQEKTITVYNKFIAWKDLDSNNDIALSGLTIDAKTGYGIDELKNHLYQRSIGQASGTEGTIVTNARHHAALLKIKESLDAIQSGLEEQLSGDLLTIDIRRALHYLGEITGQVEVDRDILGTIFGKFCIGK